MLLYIEFLCVLLIMIYSMQFRGTYRTALPFGVTGVQSYAQSDTVISVW